MCLKPHRLCPLLIVLILLAAMPTFAGVVYEIEVTDHQHETPKTESIQAAVEGRHLKMGIASGGQGKQGDMIFRGDRREMYVVDHDERSYIRMDEKAIEELSGQVSAALGQMKAVLDSVPADQRAKIEEMMKQNMPNAAQPGAQRPQATLKKTGEKATKSGYPCVKYEVLQDGRKMRELWVTDWSNVEGGRDVADAFEDMADFFSTLMDALPQMGQGGPTVGDGVFEHMKEIGGFPVVTREFGDDGSLEGETTLRSSARRTLDPSDFEPPAGYKRRSMGPI
ncbi:MAG: DUF4412 domain-containing protein [Acidobacteriota bacterium]